MKYQSEKIGRPYQWLFSQMGIFLIWTISSSAFLSALPNSVASIVNYLVYIGLTFLSLRYILHFSVKKIITTNDKFQWKNFFLYGFLWFAAACIFSLIYYIISPSSFSKGTGISSFSALIIPLLLLIIAVFFEELIFRGYFAFLISQDLPKSPKMKLIYSVLNGLVFALAHWQNPELGNTTGKEILILSVYFIFGIFLMYLMLSTGGLEATLGTHLANNLFCFFIVSYPNSAISSYSLFTKNTIYNWENPASIVFAILVCLAVLKKVKKKNNESK